MFISVKFTTEIIITHLKQFLMTFEIMCYKIVAKNKGFKDINSC